LGDVFGTDKSMETEYRENDHTVDLSVDVRIKLMLDKNTSKCRLRAD
jgi:hypothetical protein